MSIFFAILLFSFLIFVHELGHFVTAKLSGVQVNEFALFMGPAIFKKKVGETLYSIRCIPFGGYCAMEGEDADTENPRSFQKAAWWKRLIILVAGSAMNFIAGVLIFTIIFLPAKQVISPVISDFTDCCVFHNEDGLHIGDEFLEIDGEPVYLQGDVNLLMTVSTKNVHDVVVLRDGKRVSLHGVLVPHACVDEKGQPITHYGFAYGAVKVLDFSGRLDYIWKNVLNTVRNVRLSLQMLLSGQAGLKDMSGPVGIVQMMSESAEQSENTVTAILNMLYFGGFIAINLAVMNLLPIPALDGGRVVCLLITTAVEKITRKKIDPKYEGYFHAAGMLLLLGLMGFIMFKDIFTIFKG